MIKHYQDVKVSELQRLYQARGEAVACDGDKQQVVVDFRTFEWMAGDLWQKLRLRWY